MFINIYACFGLEIIKKNALILIDLLSKENIFLLLKMATL
jgi:hypothetical protein